jgi:AsmA protein
MAAVAIVAALAVVVAIAVPYVASTRLVRQRIAVEIGLWSGYRVVLGAPPTIEIWPRLRTVLNDVSFYDPAESGAAPVATSQRIEIELSALDALRGDAVFRSAVLVRPVVRLRQVREGLFLPDLAGRGRLRAAIDGARATAQVPADTGASPRPDRTFGAFRISEGKIVAADPEGDRSLVTSIDGTVSWPTFNAAGRVTLTGQWNGEAISVDLQSASPLTLLAGGTGQTSVKLSSEAGEISFDGQARLAPSLQLDGRLALSTSALDRALLLAEIDRPEWRAVKSLSASGQVTGSAERVRLDQATMVINGQQGDGAIDVSSEGGAVRVAGSLAFTSLDSAAIIDVTMPFLERLFDPAAGRQPVAPIVDLRFSSGTIRSGAVTLGDVAATVALRDGSGSVDILEADALGGTLRASLKLDRSGADVAGALRVQATDVDGAAVAAALHLARLVPQAKGSFTVEATARSPFLATLMARTSGTASVRFGSGRIDGFDITAFLDKVKAGRFFSLGDVERGSTTVDKLSIDTNFSGGIVRIDAADLTSGQTRLWATGLLSYADRGVALNGGITPASPDTTRSGDDRTAYFVGGAWSAPLVSPLLTDP